MSAPAVPASTPSSPAATPSTVTATDAWENTPAPAATDTAQLAPDTLQQNPPQVQATAQPVSAPDDTRIVRTKRKEDVEQLTRRYFGAHTGEVLPVVLKLNPGIAAPPKALPAGTPVMIPSESETTSSAAMAARRSDKVRNTRASALQHRSLPIPVYVKVEHTQTIFEFAMEHYGKADRVTVQTIQAANPQIHDIYQTLRQGQSMTLPAELDPMH